MEKSITYYKKLLLQEMDSKDEREKKNSDIKEARPGKREFGSRVGLAKYGQTTKGGYDSKSDEEKAAISADVKKKREERAYKQKGVTCDMCERYEKARKSGNEEEAKKIRDEIISVGKDTHKHSQEHSMWGKVSNWIQQKVLGKSLKQMQATSGGEEKHSTHEGKQRVNKLVMESIVRFLIEEETKSSAPDPAAGKALDAYINDPKVKKDAEESAKQAFSDAPPPITAEKINAVMNSRVKKAGGDVEIKVDAPKFASAKDVKTAKVTKDVKGEVSEDGKPLKEAGLLMSAILLLPAGLELFGNFIDWVTNHFRESSGRVTDKQKTEWEGIENHIECLSDYKKVFDKENDHDLDEATKAMIDHLKHELAAKKSVLGIGNTIREMGHFAHALYIRPVLLYFESRALSLAKAFRYDEETKKYEGDKDGKMPTEKQRRLIESDQYRRNRAEIAYSIIWISVALGGGVGAAFAGAKTVLKAEKMATVLGVSKDAIAEALTLVKAGVNAKDAFKAFVNMF